MNHRFKEMIELSNSLSLDDMCILINAFSQNISVFSYPDDEDEIIHACTNGHSIQINDPQPR